MDNVLLDLSAFASPDRLKSNDSVLALEKKMRIYAKDEDIVVAEDLVRHTTTYVKKLNKS